MPFTIAEIADALGASAEGATDLTITELAEPGTATAEQLALVSNPKYASKLAEGEARAALLWADADWRDLGLEAAILVQRPRFAMSGLTALVDPGQDYNTGIHPTAIIDPSAEIGIGTSVGPYVVIGPGAQVGAHCVIGPQCYIGAHVRLGEGAYLREQVTLGARVRIGERFIAQPGARIGGDGFSFVTPEDSAVEAVRDTLGDQDAQAYARIHSLGAVRIGDDVEVGANATIDSGTIRATEVGDGSKIDNLVQVGHNVVIGKHCLICAQTGIAGSVTIGNHVVMAGQTGVTDNIFIGDRVISGGGSKILSNVPAGRVLLGYPATKMESQLESYKALRRLPRLMRDVAELRKAVFKSGAKD